MAVPLVASVATAATVSRVVTRPHGLLAVLGWWMLVAAVSTVVLMTVDRLARRLLPLAALLRLSMVFPDKAPSRFSVAARSGTIRNLEEHLARARDDGVHDEPAVAAARILALVGALNAHDRKTRGHSERVRAFNDLLAEEMRLSQYDRDRLRWSALLHDIGKLHVSPRILNKPGRPTEREWATLKRHPVEGALIAAPLVPWLGEWGAAIEQHHERWDGDGYPHGVAGRDISFGARIVAVADAYEVMTAPRPYSRPVSAQAARRELARCAGTHFDPDVVRAFLNISLGELRKVMGPLSWLAQLPFLGSAPRLESAIGLAGRQIAAGAGAATSTGVLAVGLLTHPHAHAGTVVVNTASASASARSAHHAPPAHRLAAENAAPEPAVAEASAPAPTPPPSAATPAPPVVTPAATAAPPPAGQGSTTAAPAQPATSTPAASASTSPNAPAPAQPAPTSSSPPAGGTATAPPAPAPQPAATPAPTRTVTGTYSGLLTVHKGETVLVSGATVIGPVRVEPGGGLVALSSSLTGPIQTDHATTVVICGTTVNGPLSVAATTGAVLIGDGHGSASCAGNTIDGRVSLVGNAGALELGGNVITGPVSVIDNKGGQAGPENGLEIEGNRISGTLSCTGNSPFISNDGVPNTASAATGQCAGF